MKRLLAALVAFLGLFAPSLALALAHAGVPPPTEEHLRFHDDLTGHMLGTGQWSGLGEQAFCAGETGIVGFLYGNGPVMAVAAYFRFELMLGALLAVAVGLLWRMGAFTLASLAWRRMVQLGRSVTPRLRYA